MSLTFSTCGHTVIVTIVSLRYYCCIESLISHERWSSRMPLTIDSVFRVRQISTGDVDGLNEFCFEQLNHFIGLPHQSLS